VGFKYRLDKVKGIQCLRKKKAVGVKMIAA